MIKAHQVCMPNQLADLMKNSYATRMQSKLLEKRIGKPAQSLLNWL
jgi:hypothetical protein